MTAPDGTKTPDGMVTPNTAGILKLEHGPAEKPQRWVDEISKVWAGPGWAGLGAGVVGLSIGSLRLRTQKHWVLSGRLR